MCFIIFTFHKNLIIRILGITYASYYIYTKSKCFSFFNRTFYQSLCLIVLSPFIFSILTYIHTFERMVCPSWALSRIYYPNPINKFSILFCVLFYIIFLGLAKIQFFILILIQNGKYFPPEKEKEFSHYTSFGLFFIYLR